MAPLYRNNLKDREFSIAQRQGSSEEQNFEGNATQEKTHLSGCFGISTIRRNNPYAIYCGPIETKVPPAPPLPAPAKKRLKPLNQRNITPVWEYELQWLALRWTKAPAKEFGGSLEKAVDYLRFQSPKSSQPFYEIGEKIYEKFWSSRPSFSEVRDFWVSHIQFMGAVSPGVPEFSNAYQRIMQDAFRLSCPVPWSVTLHVLHFMISKSTSENIVLLTNELRRDFLLVFLKYLRFHSDPNYLVLLEPVIEDLQRFRTSLAISHHEKEQAQYFEMMLKARQASLRVLQ